VQYIYRDEDDGSNLYNECPCLEEDENGNIEAPCYDENDTLECYPYVVSEEDNPEQVMVQGVMTPDLCGGASVYKNCIFHRLNNLV
jgi:hypothetical protein